MAQGAPNQHASTMPGEGPAVAVPWARGGEAREVAGPDAVDERLQEAAERVFLTPRVVDQPAFEDLASQLRTLVREATAQGAALRTNAQQLRESHALAEPRTKELQGKLEASTRVMAALDTRLARATQLLDRVSNEAALSKARELRDVVMQELAREREAAVRELVAPQVLRELAQRAIEDAVQAALRDGATRARREVDDAVGQAISAGVDRARLACEERLAAVTSGAELRARESTAQLLAALDAGVARACETQARLDESARAHERAAEAAANEVSEQLRCLATDVEGIVRRARIALGSTGDGAAAKVRVEGLDEAARLQESLRAAQDQGRALLASLSERIEASALAMDQIEARAAALTQEASGFHEEHTRGQPAPTTSGEASDHPQPAWDVHTLHQAQQVGAWLASLVLAAEHASRTLHALLEASGSVRGGGQGR